MHAISNAVNSLIPIRTAPAISNMVARIQAWVRVRTLEPTLVPNELATSLAPMPKASTNATRNPQTTSHNKSSSYGSIAFLSINLREIRFKSF